MSGSDPGLRVRHAVRSLGTNKLTSGSFYGYLVMEPGSRDCQVMTGSPTFLFITLLPRALAWLLSLPHLYEVPEILCGQQRPGCRNYPSTVAAWPGGCSDLSAGHSALCLRPLRGALCPQGSLRMGRQQSAWAISSRGESEVGLYLQRG